MATHCTALCCSDTRASSRAALLTRVSHVVCVCVFVVVAVCAVRSTIIPRTAFVVCTLAPYQRVCRATATVRAAVRTPRPARRRRPRHHRPRRACSARRCCPCRRATAPMRPPPPPVAKGRPPPLPTPTRRSSTDTFVTRCTSETQQTTREAKNCCPFRRPIRPSLPDVVDRANASCNETDHDQSHARSPFRFLALAPIFFFVFFFSRMIALFVASFQQSCTHECRNSNFNTSILAEMEGKVRAVTPSRTAAVPAN